MSRFADLLAFAQQRRIESNAQWLLVAGKPDACTAILAAAFNLHPIQFLLQFLSVLLDLLGFAERFGELPEIGESEPAMVLLTEPAD